jgi:protein required for attachment to host cells
VLRQAYSDGLRHAVRAEIDKDYVKMPVHEIEKALAA